MHWKRERKLNVRKGEEREEKRRAIKKRVEITTV